AAVSSPVMPPSPAAAASPARVEAVPAAVSITRMLPVAWIAGSAVLVAWLAWGCAALAMRRRRWRAAVVERTPVLVSADTGPAVVGFADPDIVLPEWMLDADARALRMVVRHEREHVAARDPLLLLGGFACAVLTPWNPAVWWQLARLRLAVEVDCDARVLGARADVESYGRLLIEVGRRSGASALPVPAFSEPRSSLERRIRAMTDRIPRDRLRRALLLAPFCAGAVAAVLALPVPRPVILRAQGPQAGNPGSAVADTPVVISVSPRPASVRDTVIQLAPGTVVPGTRPPAVEAATLQPAGAGTQATEVISTTVRAAAAGTQPAEVVTATVRPSVAGTQSVLTTTVPAAVAGTRPVRAVVSTVVPAVAGTQPTAVSSTVRPAVAGTQAVAATVRPAVAGVRPTAVATGAGRPAVAQTVVSARGTQPAPAVVRTSAAATARGDTTFPVITNAAQVTRELERRYPPALRAAGVEGDATVRIRVNAEGGVAAVTVVEASRPEFGAAAREAIRVARFRPARANGRAVAKEVDLPLQFALSPAPAAVAGQPPRVARPAQWDQAPVLANPDEVTRALTRNYPAELRAGGVEGTATVRIRLAADGSVQGVEVVSASRSEFGPAAVAAMRTARFRPARKGGSPVAVEVHMPVLFSLSGKSPPALLRP
ncbi:MAG TPA: TonB family protein, partial [Longimicrobium sp.]|nr:TonB family protein [Longimicrobium sp.]